MYHIVVAILELLTALSGAVAYVPGLLLLRGALDVRVIDLLSEFQSQHYAQICCLLQTLQPQIPDTPGTLRPFSRDIGDVQTNLKYRTTYV
eukprot:7305534-Pyramimonas_sp.AAC.1